MQDPWAIDLIYLLRIVTEISGAIPSAQPCVVPPEPKDE
jgi:hypothetical protein